MKLFFAVSLLFCCFIAFGQPEGKQKMDHNVWDEWSSISNQKISADGKWISYTTSTHNGDPIAHLYEVSTDKSYTFNRAHEAKLTFDNNAYVFIIKNPKANTRALERAKTKKKDMPKDTLGIYYLSTNSLLKIPNLESFKLPEEGGGIIAYQVSDTTSKKKSKAFPLIIHNTENRKEDTLQHISTYTISKDGSRIAAINLKKDSTLIDGVWVYDRGTNLASKIYESRGKYSNLVWSEDGKKLALLADLDTSKARIRPFELMVWEVTNPDHLSVVVASESTYFPADYTLSKNYNPTFSKDGSQLLFGIAPYPLLEDTTLVKDEIVHVEVWSYDDDLLYTQQESQLDRQKKRTYRSIYHFETRKVIRLQSEETTQISMPPNILNHRYAITENPTPYQKLIAWEGINYSDVYLVDTEDGSRRLIQKKVDGNVRISPGEKYLYWYQSADTAWYVHSINSGKTIQLTNHNIGVFYNEINDRPMHPRSYSSPGWTTNDHSIIIYDRYDLWFFDPAGNQPPKRLTNGRASKNVYRYIKLDPEQNYIQEEGPWVCSVFNESDKSAGYVQIEKNGTVKVLTEGPYRFGRLVKSKESDQVLFTRENFREFPDLFTASLSLSNFKQVSNANPQQANYRWGSIELYQWVSSDGIDLEGMLVKPDDFDPNKKYPLMVNFYEKSSNRIHRYPTISPGGSSINYAYYVNQGYIIFNPNIPYKIGWPGESAYNAVISGITALIQEGYIDKERIGVQGHSWGGYQIAHLITRSNLFACAEAGAPVVNMFSAYGGIRWGSGMSRMFQYEHSQSRIGGTIWDKTIRYINNSPIFFTDKIETPVLILHNDEDTAVPWYQGIEFFMSLRRLNKPAWLLNYNGEFHGISKWQNRIDFQRRMSQFFDHFLLDQHKPSWMQRGVPAIEKSILQGFESVETDKH